MYSSLKRYLIGNRLKFSKQQMIGTNIGEGVGSHIIHLHELVSNLHPINPDATDSVTHYRHNRYGQVA